MRSQKNLHELKECLHADMIRIEGRKPSWFKILHRAIKCYDRRYIFWWRIATYLHESDSYLKQRLGKRIYKNIQRKYPCDITLGAKIGKGFHIYHYPGVVITDRVDIGENFSVKQNTTIGVVTIIDPRRMKIGNNVNVGANSCIIGDDIEIGDNVTIGAATFINKSVPAGATVVNKRKLVTLGHKFS